MIEISQRALESFIEGALAIRNTDLGVQPLRLSDETMDHSHSAVHTPFVAEAANGIRLRFATAAAAIELDFSLVLSERTRFALSAGMMTPATFDLRLDDRLHDRRTVSHHIDAQTLRIEGIPHSDAVAEIWLPHNVGVVLHQLRASAPLIPQPDTRPRWIMHGSSITHDARAPGPSDTWPAQLAREAGWHVTNLGFRGECHLDAFVARAMSAARADLIALELGINVHNQQSMRERAFSPATHGFLQSLRDGHPHIPLSVISPVFGAERETQTHSTTFEGERRDGDLTLPLIRRALREAVEKRIRQGDTSISYVDGLSLLGAEHAALFFDGLHPDARGTNILRSRLATLLARP